MVQSQKKRHYGQTWSCNIFVIPINHVCECVAGVILSPSMYGNLWKMDGPTETCEEQTLEKTPNCGDEVRCYASLHINTTNFYDVMMKGVGASLLASTYDSGPRGQFLT